MLNQLKQLYTTFMPCVIKVFNIMKKLNIKKAALQEALLIREYATPEEIARLDFPTIDYHTKTGCVYGQMTGSCESQRAGELIKKCCQRSYSNRYLGEYIDRIGFAEGDDCKNAVLTGKKLTGEVYRRTAYLSALEVAISNRDTRAGLVAVIKGEKDTL